MATHQFWLVGRCVDGPLWRNAGTRDVAELTCATFRRCDPSRMRSDDAC